MKIFKNTPQWNIMGKRKIAFILTGLLIAVSIISIFAKEIKYGIDFSGGTLVQVKFQQEPSIQKIRDIFQEKLKQTVEITTFGEEAHNEFLITLSQDSIVNSDTELSDEVGNIIKMAYPDFDTRDGIRRVETVGPKVGGELKTKSMEAALFAFIGILIYIGIRFKLQYGIGAIVAIFHDVIITMGIFVLSGKEFTLTIVAALLTIIGYSLNDTIVVFDRIRENVAKYPKREMSSVINLSINESLSRTILTSLTTFLVVLALFVFGGDIIHDFSFAMLIGLVVGTYSSIFVASPVVMALNNIDYSQVLSKSK